MEELQKLLANIEKKPALFIGCKDIRFLRHFLSGYCMAKEKDIPEYGDWLFNDFRCYLAKKYNDTRVFDWCSLIMEHESDGDSTDAFFRLLHVFYAGGECP